MQKKYLITLYIKEKVMKVSKIIKKASICAVAYAMLLTALPMVSYANESDDILAHNIIVKWYVNHRY